MSDLPPLTGCAADLHRYLQQGRDRDDQGSADWWQAYVGRIQAAADTFRA